MTPRLTRSALLLSGLAALAAAAVPSPARSQGTEAPPPFSETIEVREVEVYFDASHLPTFESLGRKGIEDFAAYESGVAHDLIGLAETTAADWVHVLYFDSLLAGPEARAGAAAALAERAATLVAGGHVEIVVADPKPRLLLSTASPELLAQALNDLAGEARRSSSRPAPAPGLAERRLQIDRMVGELAARGGAGAHAVWVAVDGWPLSPLELERWSSRGSLDPALAAARSAVADGARALGAYGWVTFPLALRAEADDFAPKSPDSRTQVTTGGTGDERTVVPIVSVSASRSSAGASRDQMDTLTDFSLTPLAELARATSGTLVGTPARLKTALAALTSRRRATYRGPQPAAGEVVPLEIRWRGGDGRTLPATQYLRSSTPPQISTARLRALLAGDAPPAAAAISFGAPRSPAAAGAREACFRTANEELPVRVSIAYERLDGAIEMVPGEAQRLKRDGDAACAPVPVRLTSATKRFAWIAENLDDESWTGGVESAP